MVHLLHGSMTHPCLFNTIPKRLSCWPTNPNMGSRGDQTWMVWAPRPTLPRASAHLQTLPGSEVKRIIGEHCGGLSPSVPKPREGAFQRQYYTKTHYPIIIHGWVFSDRVGKAGKGQGYQGNQRTRNWTAFIASQPGATDRPLDGQVNRQTDQETGPSISTHRSRATSTPTSNPDR